MPDQTLPTEPVVTPKMWQAGLVAARRAGMGPLSNYGDYRHFKMWLCAAYRAMRAAEERPAASADKSNDYSSA